MTLIISCDEDSQVNWWLRKKVTPQGFEPWTR